MAHTASRFDLFRPASFLWYAAWLWSAVLLFCWARMQPAAAWPLPSPAAVTSARRGGRKDGECKSIRKRITACAGARSATPTGSTCIVTGGARGIGLAISRRLAELGFHVVIADVDLDGARRAAEGIGASFPRATAEAAFLDLSDPRSVRNFAAAALSGTAFPSPRDTQRAGNVAPQGHLALRPPVAALINNAGVIGSGASLATRNKGGPMDMPPCLTVNALGPALLTSLLLDMDDATADGASSITTTVASPMAVVFTGSFVHRSVTRNDLACCASLLTCTSSPTPWLPARDYAVSKYLAHCMAEHFATTHGQPSRQDRPDGTVHHDQHHSNSMDRGHPDTEDNDGHTTGPMDHGQTDPTYRHQYRHGHNRHGRREVVFATVDPGPVDTQLTASWPLALRALQRGALRAMGLMNTAEQGAGAAVAAVGMAGVAGATTAASVRVPYLCVAGRRVVAGEPRRRQAAVADAAMGRAVVERALAMGGGAAAGWGGGVTDGGG